MRYQPLPVVGGSYADESLVWSAQDTCNWIPSQAEAEGTKTQALLKTPPGLKPFAETVAGGGSAPVRGSWNAEGKFFCVIGTTLYQLSNAGVFIPLGTVPGTGRVGFAHNQISLGNQVVAMNGSAGYVYNTRTQVFERITDPGFYGGFSPVFIDGYILSIASNRRFVETSDVANALEYNTLDRFTSEFSPDLLVGLAATNNELFVLSETSGEFFENTGAAQQPFRSKRITMDRGCGGSYTIAKADNTVFWLGNNGYFYVLNGYAPQRISTRAIEQSILGLNWKQAYAFAWEDSGHTVIYWTFPDGLTWGYDTSTGLWHRRASYGLNRWRANTMTFWNQKWYVGDFQYGRIWEMDWNYILEGDEEFISERTTSVIHDNQNRIIIPRLELLMQVGQVETVPTAFPEQPDPPVISGAAPDGTVGLSWAGVTYTATGGTPPYAFSERPGTVYPGNLGPMNAVGVVAAEVPTEAGEGTIIPRVTDANGLFDELTDTFNISNAVALLGLSRVTLRPFLLFGAGGTDWDNAYAYNGNTPLLQQVGLLGGDGRWVTWPIDAQSPIYSTDATGTAWATSAAVFEAPSKTPYGCYEPTAGAFLIPANNGVYRTVDHGITLTKVTTIPAYAVDASPTLAMSASQFDLSVATAPTPFTTWTLQATAHGIDFAVGGIVRYGDGRFLIGGGDGGGDPILKFTTAGASFTTETLPTLLASYISAACYSEPLDTWVAATSVGEFIYKVGTDPWELSAYAFGADVKVQSIEWTGVNFVAAGDHNVTVGLGVIAYSADGIGWTTAPTLEPIDAKDLAVMR